jgi:hypothetical protein
LFGNIDLVEEELVIARFCAENKAQVKPLQLLNVRTVTGQTIFNDDNFQSSRPASPMKTKHYKRVFH